MSLTNPATLGKYEVRGVIGRGEMGTVYEGWDPQIDRRVAIKTVRLSASGDSEAVEAHSRFKREAQAAGRLTHPSIVGIYDYGETGDLAYIVMEYVEGDSLKAVLGRNERLPVNETMRLMEELLAGLQFSHERGVVHRDIKPANVMLTKDGRVKIADFGIARIESSSMTQAGTVMGTPAYMSPEQFMGQPVDKRTDIYSAGVLLYQLLTGERPFEGSVSGIMHKVLNTTPPRPSEVSVTAPPAFDAVVARAMGRRPDDRYPSASAFATDLRRAFDAGPSAHSDGGAEDATIVGTTKGPRVEQKRPVARQAPVPMVAAAAAVVLLAIVGGATWFLMRPSGPAPKVVVAEGSSATQPVAVVSAIPTQTGSPGKAAPAASVPSPTPAPISQPATSPPASPTDAGGAAGSAAAQSGASAEAPPTTVAGPSTASQASVSAPASPATSAERVEPLVAPSAGQAASEATQATSGGPPPSVNTAIAPPAVPTEPVAESAGPITPPVGAGAAVPSPVPPVTSAPITASPPPSPSPSSGMQSVAATTPPPVPAQPAPVSESQPRKTAMVMPDLRSVSRALAQLAANSNCSLVQVGVIDSGEAVVSGLVGAGAPESMLQSAVRDASPRGVTWQVRGINSTYCSALDTLRPIYRRGSLLSVMLVDGKDRLRDGEAIRPVIAMPDFPAHLQLDYLSHDGSVTHLFPSDGAPDKLLARDAKLFIGRGKEGVGTVGAPYGTDVIIAVASSVPLFPAGAPRGENDTVDRYLPKLQAAIAAAEKKSAQVIGSAFALETVER